MKKNFTEKIIILIARVKNCRPPVNHFLASFFNTAFYLSKRTLWVEVFSDKFKFTDLFRTLGRKAFSFSEIVLRQGCQNCILHVWRIILKNLWVFLEKNYTVSINFGLWVEIFFHFLLKRFHLDSRNCLLRVQRNTLRKKFFFWCFSDIEPTKFGFLAEMLLWHLQICTFCVQRNLLSRILSETKMFSYQYRTLSGKLWPFLGSFRAKVSKLHSTFQSTILRENFLWKNCDFSINLYRTLSGNLLSSWLNFSGRLAKLHLRVQSNISRKTVFLGKKNKFFDFLTMNEFIVAFFV